jgi:VRR-NUC domain
VQAVQLHLFKGKRQRGVKLAAPREDTLHFVTADVLRRWAAADWRWTYFPAGEKRSKPTAAMLKRKGLKRGVPDFIFWSPQATTHFLECKREGVKVKDPDQIDFAAFAVRAGYGYALCDNFHSVLLQLQAWGVVPRSIRAV